MENKLNYLDANTNDFVLYAISDAFNEIEKLEKKVRRLNRSNKLLVLAAIGYGYYLYSKKKKEEKKDTTITVSNGYEDIQTYIKPGIVKTDLTEE